MPTTNLPTAEKGEQTPRTLERSSRGVVAGWVRAWRMRQPGSPFWRIAWWHVVHAVCYLWVGTCFRYRSFGSTRIPSEGPVLFVSNHQSYLDPILVGMATHRRQFCPMARSTLFRNPMFAWLIRSLNSIPVERGTADTGAIRAAVQALKSGHAMLIFPEGTRTSDGRVAPFQNGTLLLVKKTGATVVPVAVDGAYDVWPKHRKRPRLTGHVTVRFGEPIPGQRLMEMGGHRGANYLREIIEGMLPAHARGLAVSE